MSPAASRATSSLRCSHSHQGPDSTPWRIMSSSPRARNRLTPSCTITPRDWRSAAPRRRVRRSMKQSGSAVDRSRSLRDSAGACSDNPLPRYSLRRSGCRRWLWPAACRRSATPSPTSRRRCGRGTPTSPSNRRSTNPSCRRQSLAQPPRSSRKVSAASKDSSRRHCSRASPVASPERLLRWCSRTR